MTGSPSVRHEFLEANGLRFHVAKCEPEPGTAGGGSPAKDRLALCLHGFPECWYSFRYQLPLLARLGYRAWAPDLRGYGRTDKPKGFRHYAIEQLMDDVAALIDASGASEVMLLAHDWGGVIAWYFAMRRIRPLDRLVVMNLPHPACMAEVLARKGNAQRRRSWYALFFQLPWLPEMLLTRRRSMERTFRDMALDPSRFPDEVLAVYREEAARPGAARAMVDYYRALIRGGGARRQAALGHPVIDTPTLLLWGEEDVALGKETTLGTERHVPNLTLRYLPGVSHWVQQEAPEKVNAMIEAWVQEGHVPEAHEVAA